MKSLFEQFIISSLFIFTSVAQVAGQSEVSQWKSSNSKGFPNGFPIGRMDAQVSDANNLPRMGGCWLEIYLKNQTSGKKPDLLSLTHIVDPNPSATGRGYSGLVVYERPMSFNIKTNESQQDSSIHAAWAYTGMSDVQVDLFRVFAPVQGNEIRGSSMQYKIYTEDLPGNEKWIYLGSIQLKQVNRGATKLDDGKYTAVFQCH